MADQQPQAIHFGQRHYFLIRRLHSLTGLIPVGVFLFVHLLTNASILAPGAPGAEYQRSVERIHELGSLLPVVEIVGIFIPILFHALLGFQIIFTGQSNAQAYPYGDNIRYSLQRWTGVIAFVFILFHLWQLHWLGKDLGGGEFAVHDAAGRPTAALTTALAIQSAWWITPLYAIGIIASVYHLANGIWTSLITWGITIHPRTQQVAGYACAAFGVALGLIGIGALTGFRTFSTSTSASSAVTSAHSASAVHDEP